MTPAQQAFDRAVRRMNPYRHDSHLGAVEADGRDLERWSPERRAALLDPPLFTPAIRAALLGAPLPNFHATYAQYREWTAKMAREDAPGATFEWCLDPQHPLK